jgi:cytidylate kinase
MFHTPGEGNLNREAIMPVITIRGQMGSGAPDIGRLVAAHFNIDYIDREIIADIASKLNYPEQKIEKQEMPPTGLIKRIKDAIEHTYPSASESSGSRPVMMYLPISEIPLGDFEYLAGLESVIKKLAADNAIVIRGRGSQFILKDHPGAIHILTVAPLGIRIKRIMKKMKVDEKSAVQEIQKFDSSRREFVKRYFKANLEDPVHYNLVINTGHLDYEAAAAVITGARFT